MKPSLASAPNLSLLFVAANTVCGKPGTRSFKPNLSAFALGIKQIIALHFQHARDLLLTTVRFPWTGILLVHGVKLLKNTSEISTLERPVDVLIDAARDLIEWMLEHRPDDCQDLILDWSKSPLFDSKARVNSRHTSCSFIEPRSEGSAGCLQKDWLYSWPLKHEVFQLLKSTYQHCEETTRDNLLNSVISSLRKTCERMISIVPELISCANYWTGLPEQIRTASRAAAALRTSCYHCPDLCG